MQIGRQVLPHDLERLSLARAPFHRSHHDANELDALARLGHLPLAERDHCVRRQPADRSHPRRPPALQQPAMHRHQPVHRLPRRPSQLAHRRIALKLRLKPPPRPEAPAILMPRRSRPTIEHADGQLARRNALTHHHNHPQRVAKTRPGRVHRPRKRPSRARSADSPPHAGNPPLAGTLTDQSVTPKTGAPPVTPEVAGSSPVAPVPRKPRKRRVSRVSSAPAPDSRPAPLQRHYVGIEPRAPSI